ncbi:hypothetical protein Tco_0286923 [Tanacetum coccineum]
MLRLCYRLIACNIARRIYAPEKVTEGAPVVNEDAHVVDERALAILAPVQAPHPPLAARTIAQRLSRLEEDVHGLGGALGEKREVLDNMAHDFSRFTTWTVTRLSRMMDQDGVRYMSYSDCQIPYVRHTRRRTNDARTSAPQQPDP